MSTVLVTGATGNVGRPVVTGLLAAGVPVRAAVRDPRTVTGDPQLAGAVAVAFDFTDPGSWAAAFADVRTMFLVRPPQLSRVKRDLLPALRAAELAGVRHVVFLSLQGAERNRVVPHAAVERWLRSSSMEWTFLRPSFFFQNLSTTHRTDIRDRDEIFVPAGRGRTAFVDTDDIAAVAVEALRDPAGHAGKAWTLTGFAALTYDEVAQALTATLDRPIRYARPGAGRYAWHAHRTLGMPPAMVLVTTAIYTSARLGLAAGLTDDVRTVLGREPPALTSSQARTGRRGRWLRPRRRGCESPDGEERGTAVIVATLGATGRTGRLVVQDLLARGHQVRVLVRRATSAPADTCAVVGDARDPEALRSLVDGCDVVISTLGPVDGDRRLHRDVAPLLIAAMKDAGVSRFIGISGAGIDVPGDCKSRRDRLISSMIRTFGGDAATDKVLEYQAWRDSRLDWTLVRPPRLQDGPATGWIDHDAHISTKSTKVTRADLATFVAGLVDGTAYQCQAPFVATSRQVVR